MLGVTFVLEYMRCSGSSVLLGSAAVALKYLVMFSAKGDTLGESG